MIDAETGDVVDSEDKGRGYEVGKNQFIEVNDEEIENLRIESTHTIDIEKFVPRSEIDERYLDSPYYVIPEDKVGLEAFAVTREAMARKKMIGLGRVVISRRERIVMLEPLDKGLLATTLRYAYEIRKETEYFEDIPSIRLPDEMTTLAEHIPDSKAGHFDPGEFKDRYEEAVVDMLRRKQAGMPQKQEPDRPQPKNVINLMDALKRSLAAEGVPEKKPPAPSTKQRAKKLSTRSGKGARKAG